MTPRLKPLILHRKLGLTEAAVTLPEQTLTLSRDAARVDLPRNEVRALYRFLSRLYRD